MIVIVELIVNMWNVLNRLYVHSASLIHGHAQKRIFEVCFFTGLLHDPVLVHLVLYL
jgi:hypothetical protein